MTSLTIITGVSMCLCGIFHPYRQPLWNWSEALLKEWGKLRGSTHFLITSTDFVYIVYITFENPNRFRCKIYSWGKGLDVDRSSSDPSTRSITKPFVTQTLKCPIYSCFDVKHPAGLAFNA